VSDPGKEFTKVSFVSSTSDETFGFDDFTIGSRVQAATNAVPTPALLPGLIGMGIGMVRKRKAQSAQAE
jgi:hypothetical protein